MSIPEDLPVWATDANFTNGPDVGTPTKVEPTLGVKEEGFVGGSSLPSQRLNYLVNQLSAWVAAFAGMLFSNLRLVATVASRSEIDEIAFSPTNDPEAGTEPWVFSSINHAYSSPNGARATNQGWSGGILVGHGFTNWLNDRFIGCSRSAGAGAMQGSTDGITWAVLTTPFAADRYDSSGDGTILVVASGVSPNGFLTSTDGTTWTARDSGEATLLGCVTYDGTYFVAGGASGVRYSTDGITWTAGTHPSGVKPLSVAGSDGNGVVLMGMGRLTAGDPNYYRTTDHGQTWTSHTNPFASSAQINRIQYIPELNLWVMHTQVGGTSGLAMMVISTDGGLTWTKIQWDIPTGQTVTDVLWGDGAFLVLADDATDLFIYRSLRIPESMPFHL